MELDNHILAVVEPAILPTEIKFDALGEESGDDTIGKQSKDVATLEPMLMCNDILIPRNQIQTFELELSGKTPKCTITFEDRNGNFSVDALPRDGDFFTLLLNSKQQETFKSVHMDFDIVEVNTEGMPSRVAGGSTITLEGIAKIPRLFGEDCKILDPDTSLAHLEKIARDLEIGLATNIDTTDDKQSRIQAYETHLDFIKKVVGDAYISDDSFVKWHIDQYYYLNFVDINKIFNSKNPSLDEVTKSLTSFAISELATKGSDEENFDSDNIEVPMLLTNHKDFDQLGCFIEEFEVVNNSQKISLTAGNARNIQFYDNNSDAGERFQEFKIEPLQTEELPETEMPLKGNPKDERYKDQVKFKYMGRQNAGDDGLGNTHKNAIYTKLHNKQNELEIEKMKLKVKVPGFNPALYKFCKIPVLMYHYDPIKIEAEKTADRFKEDGGLTERPFGAAPSEEAGTGEENYSQMMDKFLSGFYIVENIDYIFEAELGIQTRMTLIRREWPVRSATLRPEN